MNFGGWALKHRTLVLLVLVAAVLGGAVSARQLPSGIYPEVDFPRIGVVVRQGDAPPQVFQTSITRPVEQALMTVLGVERVRSRTIRGGAEIQLLFAPRTDMWRALQLAESSLNDVRTALPADTRIRVERLTPVSFPILSFNVSGPIDSRDLNELAEFTLRPAIARVPGVGRVGVLGGDVREMEVVVDPERAAAAHLRLEDIATRVRRAVPLVAVGRFERDRTLTTVIASAEATSAADLEGVPVGTDAAGAPIALGSVARVVEGAEDRLYRTSGPHGDSVLITVARLEGSSTPTVVRDVMAAVTALRATLPAGVTVEPVYDQGLLVGESIASVRDAILIGIALCLLVLGAFLRDVRAGLVAALAVPVTLAASFLVMLAVGQTLNLMSLGGMAVSIGLVVDDAIVVVEAIARRLEEGATPEEAALKGTNDLAAAVVGTTITTVIVFLPLAFLSGVVGKFFSALATTLTAAVVLSLFVALLVVPIAAARVMRARPTQTKRTERRWLGAWVRWSARRPWVGVLGTVSAVAFSAWALGHVPSGFMPSCDEGAFVIDYFTPAGTSLTDTDEAARRIERILRETPEVATFSRRTGAQINPTAVTLLNRGDFAVRLKSGPRRHADDVIASVRGRIEREVPVVRAEFVQILQDMLNDLSGTPRPVEVKIFGPDYAVLGRIAAQVAARVERVPGAVDVYGGVERPSSQLVVEIDRVAAGRLGLAAEDVSREVGDALLGTSAGSMRRFDRLLNIRVRLPDEVRFAPERFGSLPISFGPAGQVGLASVARLRDDEAPTVLLHEGLQPVVIVTADHQGRDLGGVVRDIQAALRDLRLPPGYRLEYGGQYAGQQESSRNLAIVALAGALLVLVVLVAQFGTLRPALAVLFTAPLALVGALGALWATDTPLNASSLMGCVLLVGLVVKNGILLMEVAEEHAHEHGGAYEDALAFAAERRIRPIAMTTLATLAGLMPLALAIGAGSEMQQPLAIAVIGGLSLSAVLSLAVLPALAAGLERARWGSPAAEGTAPNMPGTVSPLPSRPDEEVP
ncbi:MAG: efflux RND transporter permease subunit [Myxococcaceae bacterium]|nr:MAG: efflux RND transporter permease subunit [Myxococcaceae bacterium]